MSLASLPQSLHLNKKEKQKKKEKEKSRENLSNYKLDSGKQSEGFTMKNVRNHQIKKYEMYSKTSVKKTMFMHIEM